MTNHNQDHRHKYHHLTTTLHLTLKMTTAQVVETSVTNNSLSKDYLHPDDHDKPIIDERILGKKLKILIWWKLIRYHKHVNTVCNIKILNLMWPGVPSHPSPSLYIYFSVFQCNFDSHILILPIRC